MCVECVWGVGCVECVGCRVCEGVWSVCGGVGCVECVWGCVECVKVTNYMTDFHQKFMDQ